MKSWPEDRLPFLFHPTKSRPNRRSLVFVRNKYGAQNRTFHHPSLHPGGANVLFAGGDATFLNATIDRHVLAAMTTIAGAPEDEPKPPPRNKPP